MRKTRLPNKLEFFAAVSFGLITLFASFCGVIGLLIWLYRVVTDQSQFSWFGLLGIIAISFILFIIGIVILKNGVDEWKK